MRNICILIWSWHLSNHKSDCFLLRKDFVLYASQNVINYKVRTLDTRGGFLPEYRTIFQKSFTNLFAICIAFRKLVENEQKYAFAILKGPAPFFLEDMMSKIQFFSWGSKPQSQPGSENYLYILYILFSFRGKSAGIRVEPPARRWVPVINSINP